MDCNLAFGFIEDIDSDKLVFVFKGGANVF
jgi:hypothetical protein